MMPKIAPCGRFPATRKTSGIIIPDSVSYKRISPSYAEIWVSDLGNKHPSDNLPSWNEAVGLIWHTTNARLSPCGRTFYLFVINTIGPWSLVLLRSVPIIPLSSSAVLINSATAVSANGWDMWRPSVVSRRCSRLTNHVAISTIVRCSFLLSTGSAIWSDTHARSRIARIPVPKQ